jgi:DNA repair exonuclease SbcCD ATPase subunit
VKITSVRAANFRTLEDVRLDLNRLPGLYYMTGKNLDRPRLGANGIGKSSIWQALYWAAYGVTTDGLRAEALCGPALPRYGVRLNLRADKRTEKVYRGWNPNRLQCDGRDVSAVSDRLRLSPEEFQATVLLCQGGEMLLDFTPAKRLELVGATLHLDIWSEYSRNAQELAAKRSTALIETRLEIDRCRTTLTTLAALTGSRTDAAEFERQRRQKIAEAKGRLRNQLKARDVARSALRKVATEKEELDAKVKRLSESIPRPDHGDRDKQLRAVTVTQSRLEQIKAQLRTLCERRSDGTWVGKRVCEVCGSRLTDEHARAHIEKLLKQSRQAVAEATEAQLVFETAEKRRAADKKRREVEETFLEDLRAKSRDAHERSATLLFEANKISRTIKDLRASIETERHAVNPHEKRERERRQKIYQAKAQLRHLRLLRSRREKLHGRADWWVRGFKEVRYHVLNEALAELTAVTQLHVLQMGMKGFNVRFIAERENKSGTTSNTFDVRIQTPYRKEPLPLKALSGGERARLRLASAFALSDLILRRRGMTCNIEVYDEPTQHLSQEGIDDVIEILKARAQAAKKQVWFVDHHNINSAAFADTVYLELKNNRTRII